MKIVTYSLASVLACLSIFTIGYLATNHYISFWGGIARIATISRFVEPTEVKSLYDLLDRLPSGSRGPVVLDTDGESLISYDPSTGYLHKITTRDSQFQNQDLQKLHPYLSDFRWSQDRTKILASDGI